MLVKFSCGKLIFHSDEKREKLGSKPTQMFLPKKRISPLRGEKTFTSRTRFFVVLI